MDWHLYCDTLVIQNPMYAKGLMMSRNTVSFGFAMIWIAKGRLRRDNTIVWYCSNEYTLEQDYVFVCLIVRIHESESLRKTEVAEMSRMLRAKPAVIMPTHFRCCATFVHRRTCSKNHRGQEIKTSRVSRHDSSVLYIHSVHQPTFALPLPFLLSQTMT